MKINHNKNLNEIKFKQFYCKNTSVCFKKYVCYKDCYFLYKNQMTVVWMKTIFM